MIKIKIIKNVQGSKESSKPIIVGKDTVYVHENIVKLETDFQGNPTDNLYQYDETQYTINEFIQFIAERQTLESEVLTTVDLEVQEVKNVQQIESKMTTEHDLSILDILTEIANIKEVLNRNGIN